MSVEWNGGRFVADLKADTGKNIEKACIYLKGKVKERIGQGQPYVRHKGPKGVHYEGQNPSAPGEPPHKITGFLQRSIAYEMAADRMSGSVGTNVEYGFFLEVGTSRMAARPWLRSTLEAEAAAIRRIIAGEK